MFLHIGSDYVINSREIVGIFDIDNCSVGKRGKLFFLINQQIGRIVATADDLPKSFIVTENNGEKLVYISGVASATLRKRVYSSYHSLSDKED